MLVPHDADSKVTYLAGVPRIAVAMSAFLDMHYMIEACPDSEVGWLGAVKELPGNEFLIERVFLFKQHVSATHNTLDQAAIGRFYAEMLKADPANKGMLSRIRFWGHLHPGGMYQPSSQDEDQMELFADNPYFIRGIFTREGRCEFCFFDYARQIRVDDCAWSMKMEGSDERRAAIAAEVAEKVKSEVRAFGQRSKEKSTRSGWRRYWYGEGGEGKSCSEDEVKRAEADAAADAEFEGLSEARSLSEARFNDAGGESDDTGHVRKKKR